MNASTSSKASLPAYPKLRTPSVRLTFGHKEHQHGPDCQGDTCALKHHDHVPKAKEPAHGEAGHVHGPGCSHGHHHDHADHAPSLQKHSHPHARKGLLGWLGNLWQGVLGFFKELFSGFFKDVGHLTKGESSPAPH